MIHNDNLDSTGDAGSASAELPVEAIHSRTGDHTHLRPPGHLIVTSLLILALCVALAAMAVAALGQTWNAGSVLGGVVLLPLPLALGWQQYRAAVCASASAAVVAMWMLIMLGGFVALFTVGTAVTLRDQPIAVPRAVPLAALAASLFCFGAAWANRRWARALVERGVAVQRVRGWRLAILVLLLVAIGPVAAFFIHTTLPQFAEHVEFESPPFGIPAPARDICYCQGARGALAYEFTIDEDGFRDWTQHRLGAVLTVVAQELRPIDTPVLMDRYSSLRSGLEQPDSVTITAGWYVEWSDRNRRVRAAFDATTRRAYYCVDIK